MASFFAPGKTRRREIRFHRSYGGFTTAGCSGGLRQSPRLRAVGAALGPPAPLEQAEPSGPRHHPSRHSAKGRPPRAVGAALGPPAPVEQAEPSGPRTAFGTQPPPEDIAKDGAQVRTPAFLTRWRNREGRAGQAPPLRHSGHGRERQRRRSGHRLSRRGGMTTRGGPGKPRPYGTLNTVVKTAVTLRSTHVDRPARAA